MKQNVIIATRGSELALWQAHHVKEKLLIEEQQLQVELLVIKTKGDKILDTPLALIGGKGLFVKEVEEALLDGRADIAVHSMKDVPTELAPGLTLAAIGKREDPRDALCSREGAELSELARGARVGTASLRRQCQLLARRPDLVVETLRGNVPTRLQRLAAGDYDAIVLAAAGLRRLGHENRISEWLPSEVCLPAVGQGALAIETRADDVANVNRVVNAMHDEQSAARNLAERSFLAGIEGGCQAPIAGHAVLRSDTLALDALVGRPDGSVILRTHVEGTLAGASDVGRRAADDLLRQGAGDILKELIEAGP